MNIAPTDRRGDNLTAAAAAAAAGGSGATSSSPPPSPSSPTCSSDAAAAAALATKRRREIQSIMRDATLTDLERRLKVQQLMDGSSAAASSVDGSGSSEGNQKSDGGIGSMMSSLSIHDNSNSSNNSNSTMQNIQSISSSSDGNINDDIDSDRSNNNHNHNHNKSPPSQVVEVSSEQQQEEEVVSCIHYERKCNIVAPCCQRTFGCRLCHDEIMSHPSTMSTTTTANNATKTTSNTTATKCKIPMDRYAISQIVCKACHTLQSSKTNTCTHCHVSFAEYHCATCNIWMSNTQSPFHCSKCGMCRVGGRENYTHCDLCGMCLSSVVYESHHCK